MSKRQRSVALQRRWAVDAPERSFVNQLCKDDRPDNRRVNSELQFRAEECLQR